MTEADPYLWLEDVEGAEALAWVRERNADAVAALTGAPRFADLRDEIREVLDSADRIPVPYWVGGHLYNFWRDEAHPRGLWRRTTLSEYRREFPEWEVLIDVDALGAAEGVSWVFQGATALRPQCRRFLVSLSRGGSDAAEIREFDVDTRSWVEGGFVVPEAKSYVDWLDRDHLYVGTDFGPGSLTSSGYPRVVKQWRRGTPLADAPVVFEGETDDMLVAAGRDQTPGFERDFVYQRTDFFRLRLYLRRPGGELVRVETPDDADTQVHREWMLVRLRTPWTVGDRTYAAGSVLAARFEPFLAGDRTLTPLFTPDEHTALNYSGWTREHPILALLEDVRSRLVVVTPEGEGWTRQEVTGLGEFSHADIADTNEESDEFLVSSAGFVEPPSLWYGRVGAPIERLKQQPGFFDPAGITVRQLFATSADGTRVPYFVVGRPDADGPTLLGGYGGFEIARTPVYDAMLGRAWLVRGGTFVLANIRGGGEYGPAWHRAALRENRPRAFEDFAAVAEDLVARGITSPERLGAEGGSNGGLLMGVMLTRYPSLFGAIVATVPLLDMLRYHRLLAGASWLEEYGDPDDPAHREFLSRYSPYQNIHSGDKYPPTLFITSTRDDRVHPGHARKMVARMREFGLDVTYYENVEGGHGAAADNEQLAFRRALALEFLWRNLG